MFEIDLKNLQIKNKNITKKKDFLTVNITSDWSPILQEVSNFMIKKKEKYYGELVKYFKVSSLNITNLETVIDTKKRKFEKNASRYINKPKVLTSLKSINTHLVCLANNHIIDNGNLGLKKTIYNLKKYKIHHIGADISQRKIYKPFLFKKNNQKIAIINTSEGEEANEKYNNHIGASDIDSYKVIDQIRSYKRKGYLIIIIAHAGVEYIPVPPPYIKDIFKNFAEEGADLVVGHHPHVSQGFEIYKNTPIFYSLGNFTMWKKNLRKNCYHSFFLNIEVQNNKLSCINLIPFQIKKNGLNLISKKIFYKYIIELNNHLKKSDMIWKAYLNRNNSKVSSFLEHLSFFYNFKEYKYNQINKYVNLSKKNSDLDYLKDKFQINTVYEDILDKWQIKYNNNFLSLFQNIFYPLYKIYIVIKKMFIFLKQRILK